MGRPALRGEEILQPRVIAVVQARTSSSRLPGKTLLPLGESTVLGCVVSRLRRARALHGICVATSIEPDDDVIAQTCVSIGVQVHRGPRDDVLARFAGAAWETRASVVVRITADCPLIEPRIVDEVCAAFARARVAYASNVVERTFPRGLDVEVVSARVLERACREATRPYEREHVTPYVYEHPDRFSIASVTDGSGARRGDWRWTLDTADDYAFLQDVESALLPQRLESATLEEIVLLLERRPELRNRNAHVLQKALGE